MGHVQLASLEYSMTVKLLTEHHLEFLSVKGCCTGSSASILFKMPHCWKSDVTADIFLFFLELDYDNGLSCLLNQSNIIL